MKTAMEDRARTDRLSGRRYEKEPEGSRQEGLDYQRGPKERQEGTQQHQEADEGIIPIIEWMFAGSQAHKERRRHDLSIRNNIETGSALKMTESALAAIEVVGIYKT